MNDSEGIVFLHGKLMPAEKACVSVFDRGFLFGDGVYEVIPVYAGKLFHLAAHLKRLSHSLAEIQLDNPYDEAAWVKILQTLVEKNGGGDLAVYLQVTRGVANRDHAFPDATCSTVFAMANPLKPVADEILQNGVSAITLTDNRWLRCDIKSIALLGNVLLRQQAVEADATEAILIRDNLVTEGAASNFFMVQNNEIITPPKSNLILPGISRDIVLDLAAKNNLNTRESDVSEQMLRQADEIWLTSSTKAILPVTKLDGQLVGSGKPGEVWKQMHHLYQQHIDQLHT
ncbi:MAG TPA: D-amino-acid transaminase [Chromatiales bacterium]|nr:D-amino-acid transaminase [Thiotrichales bacterium]HIP68572.1 D-amino-acid transaminase [Chromatiales bacterium]